MREMARKQCQNQEKNKAKQKAKVKGKPGRPKGSKNKDKTNVTLTAELELIKNMVLKLWLLINGRLSLTYLVLDGHFGNNNALQMTRQCDLQLISKLRYDAAACISRAYAGKGPRRKYGDKIDYDQTPRYVSSSRPTRRSDPHLSGPDGTKSFPSYSMWSSSTKST